MHENRFSEKQVMAKGNKDGSAAALAEATPGQCYPNPWISKGGMLLLTLFAPLDTDIAQFGSSWSKSTMLISNKRSKPGRI